MPVSAGPLSDMKIKGKSNIARPDPVSLPRFLAVDKLDTNTMLLAISMSRQKHLV